jgi:hypothetical protein
MSLTRRPPLFHKDLSIVDSRQRYELASNGHLFHIRHADIRFTKAGVRRLQPLFDAIAVPLHTVQTLAQLANAYGRWHGQATEAERERLRLPSGRNRIPKAAVEPERLERRLLLALARYLDILHADIALTPAGALGVAPACATLGIPPASITTFAQLANLQHDANRRVLAQLTSGKRSPP